MNTLFPTESRLGKWIERTFWFVLISSVVTLVIVAGLTVLNVR